MSGGSSARVDVMPPEDNRDCVHCRTKRTHRIETTEPGPADPRHGFLAVLRSPRKIGHESPAPARSGEHGFGEVLHRPDSTEQL
jgi:hypothetical protein